MEDTENSDSKKKPVTQTALPGHVDEIVSLFVVSYGGGTNSTALLIECVKRSIRIDLILFADTGGEKPHTYRYVELFSRWLTDSGYPAIQTVEKAGNGETLEENCLRMNMLPSLAYGFKSCSQKYKIQPQEKYCNNWEPAKRVWKSGGKITKFIGFDADEEHRGIEAEDKKYNNIYPLIEWGIGREDCKKIIKESGLCLPGKSACFFCPSSTIPEIRELNQTYPELADRAIRIEQNANLKSVKGLGRRFAWKSYLRQGEMFPDNFRTPEASCVCYGG